MRLEPLRALVGRDEAFVMRVVVGSSVPVNVFAGDIHFDPDVLHVESIEYNTSIANVWVQKPWYENGAGTINFGGGTTARGGFTGEGTLLTIAFRATGEGEGKIALHDARILLHDGLGTDATVAPSIDAIVTVEAAPGVVKTRTAQSSFMIVREESALDLDGDGLVGIGDLRAFILEMPGGDPRLDFSADGRVGLADFRILFEALEDGRRATESAR